MNWGLEADWRHLKARLRRFWGKLVGTGDVSPKSPIPTQTQGVLI